VTSRFAWPACALIEYIVIYMWFEFDENEAHFIFPPKEGSMNACMEIVAFSTSNKVKASFILDRNRTKRSGPSGPINRGILAGVQTKRISSVPI